MRIGGESRAVAEEMLRTPIAQLAEREWSRATAADMRRALVRAIEEHIERRLVTVPLLETV
jgi:DNA repair protein RecO (recombination protein O)